MSDETFAGREVKSQAVITIREYTDFPGILDMTFDSIPGEDELKALVEKQMKEISENKAEPSLDLIPPALLLGFAAIDHMRSIMKGRVATSLEDIPSDIKPKLN